MAWKDMTVKEIADGLGVDAAEVVEKQNLIRLIVSARQEKELSQAALGKMVGVSQGRIAQIESGIGTANVSFDVLLRILLALDYTFKIVARKAA